MSNFAIYRSCPMSAQKVRLIADNIRGLSVAQARKFLAFTPKKGAAVVAKVLNSAIANAEHNLGMDVDRLIVSAIEVGQATTLKRTQPRAKGRANPILKRRCHITVTVAPAVKKGKGQ